MKPIEFKELIKDVKDFEWFNSVPFEIYFPATDERFNFKGFAATHKFVYNQFIGWKNLISKPPQEIGKWIEHFRGLEDSLLKFVKTYHDREGKSLNHEFKYLTNGFNNNRGIFTYNSNYSDFLVKLAKHNPKFFTGAYSYFIGNLSGSNFNDKDVLTGVLLAHDFKSFEYGDIIKRKPSEKASLTRLRNDFESSIGELDNELTNHLRSATEKYTAFEGDIDQFRKDKEKLFEDWFINSKGDFENFHKDSNDKITELEDLYNKKLQLSEPAKYWKNRAWDLKVQGWASLGVLLILITIVAFSLGELLWKTPEQIYNSFFNGDKSAAIRWSIIYVTFISFLAFAVRAVTKFMFSSFHLARDSEERYTLTYFYLSLSKETDVDKEERQLILQSLFSRAETGLLKDDSTPAMPNDVLSKFMNK